MQYVTMKGGFVGKKTEKRMFCYTVLLTSLKIWLSLSLSLFEDAIKALSFCHLGPLGKQPQKTLFLHKYAKLFFFLPSVNSSLF